MVELPSSPKSVTHTHLLACVNTELLGQERPRDRPFRILDAGCGDGILIAHLDREIRRLASGIQLEIYGYDVADHGVQEGGFFAEAVEQLDRQRPDIDWTARLLLIGSKDPWPFEDDFFDLVVSNQVLEHVSDPRHFFRENQRVLRPGAGAIHLFPLGHYMQEGHLHLPMVHRIRSHDLREQVIRQLAPRMGPYQRLEGEVDLHNYAERHADYIWHWTHYLKESEAFDLAQDASLRASFRYTPEFYIQKIRQLRGQSPLYSYRHHNRGLSDSLWIKALRYVSSVTLRLENANTY